MYLYTPDFLPNSYLKTKGTLFSLCLYLRTVEVLVLVLVEAVAYSLQRTVVVEEMFLGVPWCTVPSTQKYPGTTYYNLISYAPLLVCNRDIFCALYFTLVMLMFDNFNPLTLLLGMLNSTCMGMLL